MTTEEIRELIAGLGTKTAEVAELQKHTEEELRETARCQQETDRQMQETARRQQETDREMQETDRQMKETDRQMKETDRRLTELGRQLGGLGGKFGSFTEGMALPSIMTRLLRQRFHMDVVSPRVISSNNGHSMELDVLAFSKRPEVNEVFVVEIKSHPRQEDLEQMKKILRQLRDFFPFPADKKIYGILAAVDIRDKLREKVLREGIYLARIHDAEFDLEIPENFKPRAF